MHDDLDSAPVRLDKWLWAARFFKTRSLAQTAIERGHVLIADERVKPARPLRIGERLRINIGEVERIVVVRRLDDTRRAALLAQQLYEETADSIAARARRRERARLAPEPAAQIKGRPTKQDRRALEKIVRDV
jgi:ribosome-associated heat shock protein Hsp15